MGYYVKHTDGVREPYSSEKKFSTSGPFLDQVAAERFVVALANSGKCHEAKILPEDIIKAEHLERENTKLLFIDTGVSRKVLRTSDPEQIHTMFRMQAHIQIANNYYADCCDRWQAGKNNNLSAKALGELTDLQNAAYKSYDDARKSYEQYVESLVR